MKVNFTPEMFHSIKVSLLSTEGLAKIFIALKLYRYINLKGLQKVEIELILDYLKSYSAKKPFKSLWWSNGTSAPKILADVVEALFGAIFLEGGWAALTETFGKIVEPYIFFCCKYYSQFTVDLKYDIISSFVKRGIKCEFVYDPETKVCSVHVHGKNGKDITV